MGYLGAEEPELLSVVTEYLRAHKTPQALVEELEPVRCPFFVPAAGDWTLTFVAHDQVLDEDAQDFVVKVWRVLAVETEFAHAGVDL